ncbi:NACHT and TPR domain protein [Macrophomina phaseolina MS6]|uniref:NACHT and TPR domain protein n=1 Tax=Macrophomina phaseolina (strain MS6) TaxID=1126212 RepID=K2RXC1_MACPH|nr:NACHT and TPR domain protein [Macrophomina phaseolina MS6]
MRRFFCCGPKDEAESDLPVKPAKQVSEKADRAGVTASGKTKKEEEANGETKAVKASGEAAGQSLPTEKPAIPTSEEATKDHLTAEKPAAPTTESEGITEEKQSAETPATPSGDAAEEQLSVDAVAAPAGAESGDGQLAAESASVNIAEKSAEEKLPTETTATPTEVKVEVEVPINPEVAAPTVAEPTKSESAAEERDALVNAAEDSSVPKSSAAAVSEKSPVDIPPISPTEDSPAEVFVTPAEEKPREDVLSAEPPAIPAKAEARNQISTSSTAEESPVQASTSLTKEQLPIEDNTSPAIEDSAEETSSTKEPAVVVKDETSTEAPAAQATTVEEDSPAETSAVPASPTLLAEKSVAIVEDKESTDVAPVEIVAEVHTSHTEVDAPTEEFVVPSREVVPVDPPVVLTKDDDTHSEAPSATATDLDDDASSHTTDAPELPTAREDSVIPKGSDQKITVPRLFPNNKQGDILQRVIEAYIINGRSDWKLFHRYLPKPKANGDDSAVKLTKLVFTRMLENCLSEVELTEGRIFLPILREQLAELYWEEHHDKHAIKLWRKVLGDSANGDSDSIVYRARTNATRSLCNIYFTKALEAHIAGEDPSKYAKKLEEAAGRGADPVTTKWWYAHCSSLMLTAWHQIHDDSDRALENFRFNAKCAVGKLEGRNPSNAESGFLLLAETLMTAADNWGGHVEGDENATRAMSLFLQHHYGLGAENDSEQRSAKAQTYGACETCDNDLVWGHFQTCRYCKIDLCDSCHKDLEETTLKVRVCSPIHDYFKTSGPAPHEIPKDHVLLDGEHVHYKQWIQMLKEDWGL